MDLIEMLSRAQGGGAVQNLGRQFGLDDNQTQSAIDQLAPVIAAGFKRNAQDGQGLAALLGALQNGNHQRYAEDPAMLASPDTLADGNGILGHIFGSKQVSRDVAMHAADTTGIGSGILKQMLPIIASMVMGSLSQKTRQPGLEDIIGNVLGSVLGGNTSSSQGSGGLLGDVLGNVLGGDSPDASQSAAPQRGQQPSIQDVFGDLLEDRSGGTAADDLLDSVMRQAR